jgi:hypothetical protein
MAPRANWKGYLRLSLVSCPIALYPASSLREKVSFNRLNRKTGNRLKLAAIEVIRPLPFTGLSRPTLTDLMSDALRGREDDEASQQL